MRNTRSMPWKASFQVDLSVKSNDRVTTDDLPLPSTDRCSDALATDPLTARIMLASVGARSANYSTTCLPTLPVAPARLNQLSESMYEC